MKKKGLMLHIMLLILMLCTSVAIMAQPKFGIKAGVNYSNVNLIDKDGFAVFTYPNLGYHGGIFADFPISKHFFFQPSILLSQKGYNEDRKVNIAGDTLYITATYTPKPIYLEVPVNFFYKYQFKKMSLFAGGGGYFTYGLNGKFNYKAPPGYESFVVSSGKIQFVDDFGLAKTGAVTFQRHIDLGVGGKVGLGFGKHFSFTAGGQLGLLNLYPFANGLRPVKAVISNYEGNASIGYTF
ncbi:MAG TPA: porin family protein [Niabella sp.]|jgi:hypothetical protein|nr:PorT family protein [Chitinophagaceae bacterium]HRN47947.1 porin family protein [Niabella sp.]HRO86307.1 porin family protein [Niabella sp.]HUN04162.1 porin family protein [Niabella sp.]